MKYKLGDFVRFVDEKMEGFVTRIIDDEMIGVTGEDDFEIPVPASKVTTVHGYQSGKSTNSDVIAEQKIPAAEFITKGIYLGVANDAKAGSVVHFYLINTTDYILPITLITEKLGIAKGEYVGIVQPKSNIKIYSAQLADLQLWPKLILNVLYYTTQSVKIPGPLTVEEKFKAKDFAGTKKNLPLMKEQGWLVQLDKPDLVIDAQKLKESFFKPAEEKIAIDKPVQEVDLHIEKLRGDHVFLDSAEIFKLQLAHFNKALDAAIVHQLPDITFIHGTGNGTLKNELHKILGKHPKVQTFMDARKEKFGFGATRVILK
ncbi:MAG: Smr/MutS family protein [Mucilaginibacter sp.]